VVIIDEFTGRRMPDRHWSDGLHQAVEAKEGVSITVAAENAAVEPASRRHGCNGLGHEVCQEWQLAGTLEPRGSP